MSSRAEPVPIAIRAAVLVAGVLLVVLPGRLLPLPLLITAAGVVAAVAAPRSIGSLPATVGFVIGWLAAADWTVSLPAARTVAGAAALYGFQVATALAAVVPIGACGGGRVALAWLRRCAAPVLVAAPVIALDEALPQQTGTPWIEFAGLVGVLGLATAATYVLRRRNRPLARLDGQ